jgi:hypothetical protein
MKDAFHQAVPRERETGLNYSSANPNIGISANPNVGFKKKI